MGEVTELKPKDQKEQASEILAFLNLKAGRNYRSVDVNINFIRARLQSGITMQQLRAIVAMKCREWKDDPVMNKFLRPATLFNKEKCEQYYGELDL